MIDSAITISKFFFFARIFGRLIACQTISKRHLVGHEKNGLLRHLNFIKILLYINFYIFIQIQKLTKYVKVHFSQIINGHRDVLQLEEEQQFSISFKIQVHNVISKCISLEIRDSDEI